jgi:ABC-type bacteriocin/lantibiotic exporter with double-glycine peptidase domain
MHGESEQVNGKNAKSIVMFLMKELWHVLSLRKQVMVACLVFLSILAALFEITNLITVKAFLGILGNENLTIHFQHSWLTWLDNQPHRITVISLLAISSFLLSATLRVLALNYQFRLSHDIASEVGANIFKSFIYKDFSWHLNVNTSWALGILTKNIDQLVELLLSILYFIVNAVIVAFLVVFLLISYPREMSILIPILTIYYILIHVLSKRRFKLLGDRLVTKFQQALKLAREAFGSIVDIKLYNLEPDYTKTYSNLNLDYRMAQAHININAQTPRFILEAFVLILIIALAVYINSKGSGELLMPTLGTIALAAYRLMQPAQQCFSSISVIYSHYNSVANVLPYIKGSFIASAALSSSANTTRDSLPEQPSQKKIVFRKLSLSNIAYTYPNANRKTLGNIDLEIHSSESIAIIGPSGCGKTTLANVIMGLLLPTSGSIYINDRAITDQSLLANIWKNNIAYIPQKLYFRDSTIADNITMKNKSDPYDYNTLVQCAKIACIHDFIQQLPDSYLSRTGDDGSLLSGGQRQRLGIARALYRNPELIVMDESTSALDTDLARQILSNIKRHNPRLSLISIIHRLIDLERYDKICVMSEGSVIFFGTHSQYLEDPILNRRLLD